MMNDEEKCFFKCVSFYIIADIVFFFVFLLLLCLIRSLYRLESLQKKKITREKVVAIH